jgi:hypothetical protein
MSLTQSETVFASIHEDALNDLLAAFCTDRPRYLVYGSPGFVPTTTVSATAMAAIQFPGIPGGIDWALALTVPKIDLSGQSAPLPPELSLRAGQFSARLGAELCIDCRHYSNREMTREEMLTAVTIHQNHRRGELTCFRMEVFLVGHIVRVPASTGEDAIALVPDAVELVDITPDTLESFLECLMLMILQGVLSGIRLPLRALRAGAFNLTLTVGPIIEDDRIKVRGTV